MAKNLILFTDRFPFGKGETFLEAEINYLAKEFESIIIIPAKKEATQRELPQNTSVDNSFAVYLSENKKSKNHYFLNGLFPIVTSRSFYKQALRQPQKYLHPKGFKRICIWSGQVKNMERFLSNYIKREKLDATDNLFYTYWFHLSTAALAKSLRKAKIISRAHGFDLYEDRGNKPWVGYKFMALPRLHKLFLISQDGYAYMKKNYPAYQKKYAISRLGVPGRIIEGKDFFKNRNDEFQIVSVSNMIPLKRVHLIVNSLRALALLLPSKAIRWHHFGDGPLRKEIEDQIRQQLNLPNIQAHLHGMIPNSELIEFYSKNPVNVFVNVSSSEGIPVSIMEAQAIGIPVIATDVGGTSEIVNDENGVLLPPNPLSEDIAKVLSELVSQPSKWMRKRKLSQENWNEKFNAEINYEQFSKEVKQL